MRANHLIVAGVALQGDGYPNAKQTISLLRRSGLYVVDDRAHWLPSGMHLWRIGRGSIARRGVLALHLALCGFIQAVRITLHAGRKTALVYVPYPAPLMLWWLSFLPRSWRPRCIADAYISIWDSMYRDRNREQVAGLLSRLVKRFEVRALRAAHLVLVDTEANVDQVSNDFLIPPCQIRSLPLAIDEAPFLAIQPRGNAAQGRVRVLFVGTMIPLHGIEVVLEAVHALRDDPRIEFRLVGDGQLGGQVEHALRECGNARVTWLRGWQPLDVIAREIADADICLGVFGGSKKAARVLPFKLYMYFAAGRAVISQEALSTPAGVPYPPIEPVDPLDPGGLSSAILRLLNEIERGEARGHAEREYYRHWISAAQLSAGWKDLCSERGFKK